MKQWKHWFESNKIEVTYSDKNCVYGHSRHPERFGFRRMFRIVGGLLEIGDADFDRWANSVWESFPVPVSKNEFDQYLLGEFPLPPEKTEDIEVQIEFIPWECEDCGSGYHIRINSSNGDRWFSDGHIGSSTNLAPFWISHDCEALERDIREWYRSNGYRVKISVYVTE